MSGGARRIARCGLLGLALLALGCEVGPRSGRGLRLPAGDIARGETAFRELACGRCHDVAGGPPAPEAERSEPIVQLGGPVTRVHSHGELVTAIVNPSHRISGRHPREQVAPGGVSRMEEASLNDRMTVAQLIDLVAFLSSKYELRREPLYLP